MAEDAPIWTAPPSRTGGICPRHHIAFLARILEDAQNETRVSHEDIARLRKLADWADAPTPTKWYGIIDKNEAKRAVAAATKRMGIE